MFGETPKGSIVDFFVCLKIHVVFLNFSDNLLGDFSDSLLGDCLIFFCSIYNNHNLSTHDSSQGLLELLRTVYSKLQSCLKLRNFQNPFDKDKSVGL